MIPICLMMLLVPDDRTPDLMERIAASGQVVEIAHSACASGLRRLPASRREPLRLLGFRVFEGKLRHRFGDLDLVLDDAGH